MDIHILTSDPSAIAFVAVKLILLAVILGRGRRSVRFRVDLFMGDQVQSLDDYQKGRS